MRIGLNVKQLTGLHFALYIYDDIKPDGYDWWTDTVIESETSANHFRDELAKIPANATIDIYINSLGGDVKEGIAIANQLARHPASTTAYVDGFACSIASVISAVCDRVVMPRNTLQMLHNPWTYACGNSSELHKAADDLAVITTAVSQTYLTKARDKLTAAKLAEIMDTETWLTAEQCIEYGLADEYAEQDADMAPAHEQLTNMQATARQHTLAPAAAVLARQVDIALARLDPKAKTNDKIETWARIFAAVVSM